MAKAGRKLYEMLEFRKIVNELDNCRRISNYLDENLSEDTLQGLEALGCAIQAAGYYSVPEPLFRQALEIRKKALGDEHPGTATSLNDLASLLHDQGKLTEAEPLYRQALEIRKKALGDEHPDTATSLNDLSLIHI